MRSELGGDIRTKDEQQKRYEATTCTGMHRQLKLPL